MNQAIFKAYGWEKRTEKGFAKLVPALNRYKLLF